MNDLGVRQADKGRGGKLKSGMEQALGNKGAG